MISGDSRCLVAGNWKMNGLLDEAMAYIDALGENPAPEKVEIAIMPPFTLLHPMGERLGRKGIRLGAQSVFYEEKGAFTGSISPLMLRDAGCHYVILGHSERRDIQHEANEVILKKLKASWKAGLEPILCIGEHLDEREAGKTNEVLRDQLSILDGTDPAAPLTVAYEPVWAIGTGVTPTLEQVEETHAFVHEELKRYGRTCRVLYGGSVKPSNAEDLMSCVGVNGALVGGASLDPRSFMDIVEAAARAVS